VLSLVVALGAEAMPYFTSIDPLPAVLLTHVHYVSCREVTLRAILSTKIQKIFRPTLDYVSTPVAVLQAIYGLAMESVVIVWDNLRR